MRRRVSGLFRQLLAAFGRRTGRRVPRERGGLFFMSFDPAPTRQPPPPCNSGASGVDSVVLMPFPKLVTQTSPVE